MLTLDETQTEKTDEELAAEWAAAAEEGGGDAGDVNKTLDQSEIDQLLGGGSKNESKGGIDAILSANNVTYERLPMLEVVFDRLVRLLTVSLRNLTSDVVEINHERIYSLRFGDYLDSIPIPAMLAVIKAEEWDNLAMMVIDNDLIYSIVDVLLGGRKMQSSGRSDGRPYTTIERNLMERLIQVILSDLSAAFDPISPVVFRFERLETNPRFVAITRDVNAVVVVQTKIDMDGRGGKVDFMFPYATIEPVRELLLQMFMGEKFGRDSIWETHLANELSVTETAVDAILDEFHLPLNEVLNWQKGSFVDINTLEDSLIELRCNNVPLFTGYMGKTRDHIAIQIQDVLDRKDRE